MKYLHDPDNSKNLVHEVFITVWEKMDSLPEDVNFRSYLFTAVKNRCFNYIRDRKKTVALEHAAGQAHPQDSLLETEELEREIELAINSLPEKCRLVFELSRMDGLKYAQIADKMGISVKTVEAQMSKALNVLRQHLAEFLSLLFFVCGGLG